MASLGRRPSNAILTSADITDGTVSAVKVASDVATQAELDAVGSTATTAAQALGTGDSPSFAGLTLPNDALSGDDIDGGTISNFASTGIDDNATSTAVTLDSSGRVTMPYQPAFDAYHSPSGSYSSGTTVTSLDLNATRLNKGNHYNTSNDRFVAPVAGVYQFNYRCIVNGATNNMHVRMQVNGVTMSGSDTHHSAGAGTGWGQLVIQMIVNLSANDYIQVFPVNDRGIYGGSYQSFNGHLIG